MKVRDVIKLLEGHGWRLVRTKGDHRQFRHESKPDVVTVAGKLGLDVPAGTLKNIYRRAGLRKEDA